MKRLVVRCESNFGDGIFWEICEARRCNLYRIQHYFFFLFSITAATTQSNSEKRFLAD